MQGIREEIGQTTWVIHGSLEGDHYDGGVNMEYLQIL